MSRTLAEEQSVKLAKLLIMMNIPDEDCSDILTSIETPERMRLFLAKLSVKNFNMNPQEVYQAYLDTIIETT